MKRGGDEREGVKREEKKKGEINSFWKYPNTYQRRSCSHQESVGPAWMVEVMHGRGHVASQNFQDGEC